MSLWFVAQALQLAASRLFSTLGFGGRFIGGTRADMSVGSAGRRGEENHYPEGVRNLRRRQSAPSQTKTPNTAAAPANRASHISAPPS